MTNPIYEPKGRAKEYGDFAMNIYTGCPHRCFYCFAPNVLRKDREKFHTEIEPRPGIIEATKKQIERQKIKGKMIHLCFTCDPYPIGYDSSATREIIKILKETGNHVQILTKGDGSRDFDLLDRNDRYGITIDGSEVQNSETFARGYGLYKANELGIQTWISFEPVLKASVVIEYLKQIAGEGISVKIGKLNYHPSDIDWKKFGNEAEALCKELGIEYYIKESLRAEMNK